MIPFSLHPQFYNRPILLSTEEQAAPLAVLQDFFTLNRLCELRGMLWQLVQAGLSARDTIFDSAVERQNLLGIYEDLERALEAAFLLSQQADQPSAHPLTVAL